MREVKREVIQEEGEEMDEMQAPVSSSSWTSSSSTSDHQQNQVVVNPAIGTSSSSSPCSKKLFNSFNSSSSSASRKRSAKDHQQQQEHLSSTSAAPLTCNHNQYSTGNFNTSSSCNHQQVQHTYPQKQQFTTSNTCNNYSNCSNNQQGQQFLPGNNINNHHHFTNGQSGQQTYLINGGHSYNYNSNGSILPFAQSFIMSSDNSSITSQSIASGPRNPFQELDPIPSDDQVMNGNHQQPQPRVNGQQGNKKQKEQQSKLPVADHGFPEKFYLALREIFDVLDDKKIGLLPVSEIESRWDINDENSMFSPKGLMDCLRKVAPVDGMIDFDRFCAAIKICLLKNQTQTPVQRSSNDAQGHKSNAQTSSNVQSNGNLRTSKQISVTSMKNRSASVPVPDLPEVAEDEDTFKKGLKTYIKPAQLISVPHLNHANQVPTMTSSAGAVGMKRVSSEIPVKPERQSKMIVQNGSSTVPRVATKTKSSSSKGTIIKTLKSWKDNVLDKRLNSLINPLISHGKVKSPPPSSVEVDSHHVTSLINGSNTSNGSSDMELPSHFQPITRGGANYENTSLRASINTSQHQQQQVKLNKRRIERERRSTVGVTSVDYNQLKRMTLLQHEKDLLLRGLQAVDRTRDWYMKQMNLIQEKIRICGRGSFNPSSESFEVLQEKLQFKANRIINANQHLVALMDEANFPIHMNLAFKPLLAPHSVLPFNDIDSLESQRLQEQNHVLSNDVANKQQLINKLTKERQTLLELLQSRTPVMTMNTTPVQQSPLNHGNATYNGHGNGFINPHSGANCTANNSTTHGVNGHTTNNVNMNGMVSPLKEQQLSTTPTVNTSVSRMVNAINGTSQQQQVPQDASSCFNQSNVTNYIDDSPYV